MIAKADKAWALAQQRMAIITFSCPDDPVTLRPMKADWLETHRQKVLLCNLNFHEVVFSVWRGKVTKTHTHTV